MLERSTLLFLKTRTCGTSACAWDTPRGGQSLLRRMETSMKSCGLITALSSWLSQVADTTTTTSGHFAQGCPIQFEATSRSVTSGQPWLNATEPLLRS